MAPQIRSDHPVITAQERNHLLPVAGASTEAVQQYNNVTFALITVTNIASLTTNIFHGGFPSFYVVVKHGSRTLGRSLA
ncbi:hypothetical protein D3C87_1856630 [compost metagenome]